MFGIVKAFSGLLKPRFVASTVSERQFASRKHKKFIKFAKGYVGRANRCFRIAHRRVEKAWATAYKGRKMKKRAMRRLWIMRINAGVRSYGVPYNRFIAGLNNANIVRLLSCIFEMFNDSTQELNRNVLAEMAMTEPLSFRSVVDLVRTVDPYLSSQKSKTKTLSDEEKGVLGDWRHVLTPEEIAEIESLEPLDDFEIPFGDEDDFDDQAKGQRAA